MDKNQKFTVLNPDEVIHVTDPSNQLRNLASTDTFKVSQLLHRLERNINKPRIDGSKCEVMKLDQAGWQKGTVRVKKIELEFCPDVEAVYHSGSPLDELRNAEANSGES